MTTGSDQLPTSVNAPTGGDGEGTTLGSPVRSVVGSKVTVMAVVALVAAAVVGV